MGWGVICSKWAKPVLPAEEVPYNLISFLGFGFREGFTFPKKMEGETVDPKALPPTLATLPTLLSSALHSYF